jgi:hypothetical protein
MLNDPYVMYEVKLFVVKAETKKKLMFIYLCERKRERKREAW